MKIKVKQIKETKDGTNSTTGKPYTMIKFIAEDGKEYTAFSKRVVLGAELEGEVKESEYNGSKQYTFYPNKEVNRFGRSPEERLEIIKQSSFTSALKMFELTGKQPKDLKEIFIYADEIVEWVKKEEK